MVGPRTLGTISNPGRLASSESADLDAGGTTTAAVEDGFGGRDVDKDEDEEEGGTEEELELVVTGRMVRPAGKLARMTGNGAGGSWFSWGGTIQPTPRPWEPPRGPRGPRDPRPPRPRGCTMLGTGPDEDDDDERATEEPL